MESMAAMLLMGFFFMPSNEELISHYLLKKVYGEELLWNSIRECNLYGEKLPGKFVAIRRRFTFSQGSRN